MSPELPHVLSSQTAAREGVAAEEAGSLERSGEWLLGNTYTSLRKSWYFLRMDRFSRVLRASPHPQGPEQRRKEQDGAGEGGVCKGRPLSPPPRSDGLRPRSGLIAGEISYFPTASGNRRRRISITCGTVSRKKAITLDLEFTKS